jgi:hypothetical protein
MALAIVDKGWNEMAARRLSPTGHRGDASMESGLRGSHGIAGAAMLLYCMLARGEESAMSVAADPTAEASRPPLDLRAPDIEDVLTPQQIADALAAARKGNIEEIEVEGARPHAPPSSPEVWAAIAAPFWALLHSTQAWRIFFPIPDDRARFLGAERPDATSSMREPLPGIPRMAGDPD